MQFLKQLSIIISFFIIVEIISLLIKQIVPNIAIPGSLLGMILLFACLFLNIIKLKSVSLVGNFFINNMAFFFIPSVVSLLAYFDIIEPVLGKLIIILFLSFCATFALTGFTSKITLKLMSKVDKKEK